MTLDRSLEASQAYCQQVSRQRARNFYYGMKLVPQPKRSAQFALYAWMRLADDLADEAGTPEQKKAALEALGRTTGQVLAGQLDPAEAEPCPLLWPAFADMARRYAIPADYFSQMLEGQLMDQTGRSYQTFEQLYQYCYKVASVVGLCCIEIWGYTGGQQARQLAEWRGVAFQLTNILRDVRQDARQGRVYLPAEDFDVFELKPAMFELARPEELKGGLVKMIQRAEDYYRRSAPLDRLVHRDGRACLWAMTRIYRGLLRRIRARPLCVLDQRRVRLGSMHKAWLALCGALRGRVGL